MNRKNARDVLLLFFFCEKMLDFFSTLKRLLYMNRCVREDNVQACRILLSYNIDPSIVSLQGYTAAQLAAENVLKILQGSKSTISQIKKCSIQPRNASILISVL